MNPLRIRGRELLRQDLPLPAASQFRIVVGGGNTLASGQDGINYSASTITDVPSAYDPSTAPSCIDGVGYGDLYIDGVYQGAVLLVNDGSNGTSIDYDLLGGSGDQDVGRPVAATASLTVGGDPATTVTAYILDTLL